MLLGLIVALSLLIATTTYIIHLWFTVAKLRIDLTYERDMHKLYKRGWHSAQQGWGDAIEHAARVMRAFGAEPQAVDRLLAPARPPPPTQKPN